MPTVGTEWLRSMCFYFWQSASDSWQSNSPWIIQAGEIGILAGHLVHESAQNPFFLFAPLAVSAQLTFGYWEKNLLKCPHNLYRCRRLVEGIKMYPSRYTEEFPALLCSVINTNLHKFWRIILYSFQAIYQIFGNFAICELFKPLDLGIGSYRHDPGDDWYRNSGRYCLF